MLSNQTRIARCCGKLFARGNFLRATTSGKRIRGSLHLIGHSKQHGYQRKSQRPATAPKLTTMSVADGYQIATKSGESSVQFEA